MFSVAPRFKFSLLRAQDRAVPMAARTLRHRCCVRESLAEESTPVRATVADHLRFSSTASGRWGESQVGATGVRRRATQVSTPA